MAVGSLRRKTGWSSRRGRAFAWGALATAWVVLPTSPAPASHGAPVPVLTIEPEYAKRLLDAGQPLVFVDLRPSTEFALGRLPRALSIPLSELRRRYDEIPRSGQVVLYCDCPIEELDAAFRFIAGEGFRNESVLAEGFRGWVKHGYPVER
jgi:rhodanese-related sulfurtransferase